MYCTKCWTNLPDGSTSCKKCGADLTSLQTIEATKVQVKEKQASSQALLKDRSRARPGDHHTKRVERAINIALGFILLFGVAFFSYPRFKSVLSPPKIETREPIPEEQRPTNPVDLPTSPTQVEEKPSLEIRTVKPAPSDVTPLPSSQDHLIAYNYNQKGIELLSKGDYQGAITLLLKASKLERSNATIQKNLAYSYYESGMEKMNRGEYKEAIKDFEAAMDHHEDARFFFMTGAAHFKLGEHYFAIKMLRQAISLNPNDSTSHKLLGEVLYREGRLDDAIEEFKKALEINPSDQGLQAYLKKVVKEEKVERYFQQDLSIHFKIQYDGNRRENIGSIVARIAENAYDRIGYDLGYYPKADRIIILYSREEFRDVTRAPSWSAGIYDGKIRIPIGGLSENTPLLEKIIFHEYTHSVIHAITQGNCPVWLNEGLAQYAEKVRHEERDPLLSQAVQSKQLIPLPYLQGSFLNFKREMANLAYAQSFSLVKYVIDAYGMHQIRKILETLGKRESIDNAFKQVLGVGMIELESEWRRHLERKYSG
ncbi:MAG: tetratricopeptide repeat protein [Candidatus Tectomicrobia bacterium]|nr:tetratricopeptide repeat protein [Candidatus Tectomicrobia bacterium]